MAYTRVVTNVSTLIRFNSADTIVVTAPALGSIVGRLTCTPMVVRHTFIYVGDTYAGMGCRSALFCCQMWIYTYADMVGADGDSTWALDLTCHACTGMLTRLTNRFDI